MVTLSLSQEAAQRRLAMLLTFNGGFVDTAGFLAMQGLFTAHVTGNFVTIAASLVNGTSGNLVKIAALPVFCIGILAVRLSTWSMPAPRALNCALLAHALLLMLGAGAAAWLLPSHSGDQWQVMVTGCLLVLAMSVQNGLQRVHLPTHPPGTLMTGTTTQLVLELAMVLRGGPEESAAAKQRATKMARQVTVFAVGCALSAVAYLSIGDWCFGISVVIAAMALVCVRREEPVG
jgi:uncharacterized membrane protein YoaK (UPF0700 family)